MPNLVASGLFGDGAAAVVAVGERRAAEIEAAGPRVVDSVSHLYPDSLRTMGWDVGSRGLELVLSPDVPEVVSRKTSRNGRHDVMEANAGLGVGQVTVLGYSHVGRLDLGRDVA